MQFEEAERFITEKLLKELPQYLYYHSIEHIRDVYEAANYLADGEGVAGEEKILLLTAVLFHDSGFVVSPKDHERISCDIAREFLPRYDYTPMQIECICGMIMATKVPQKPHNHLEQIICDADLDYLGRDDFFTIGNKLFTELSMYGMINSEDEWNRLQVRFLESHDYFTKTAIESRKAKKDDHLKMVRSKIE